jgi:hypothetical protein
MRDLPTNSAKPNPLTTTRSVKAPRPSPLPHARVDSHLAKANAESESYDFSLIPLISLNFSGLWGLSPGDGNL